MTVDEKLSALRKLLAENNIDAWIVPSSDPHQSEYVADTWKSREWISGFSGSAGTVVVTANKACLWTDSRYFLQAGLELGNSEFNLMKDGLPEIPSIEEWLTGELKAGQTIGFDGKVLAVSQVSSLQEKCPELVISDGHDFIDKIWSDRPAIPKNPIEIFDEKFAGESRVEKFSRIRNEMVQHGATHHIIPALDDIAWTFNIRGTDVSFNPVAVAYAVISVDKVVLFVDPDKIGESEKQTLITDNVVLKGYTEIFDYLKNLPNDATVLIDPDRTNQALMSSLNSACKIVKDMSLPFGLKCKKNSVELEGIRNAHIRDGVAMVKWMYWLQQNVGKIDMDEISIADKLEEIRSAGEKFRGLSFNTISGYKGNGAIVHYSAQPETAAKITNEGILLMDSGGQYLDGTTDITRTIALSEPTSEQKKHFTLVLKGHIQLSMLQFPKGYKGLMLDTMARAALWKEGLNYGHGTGHGVGHYLNVHEGPQQFRPTNHVVFETGMLLSNEPGFYVPDQYGIRIENLVVVEERVENEFGTFYGFETVTFCPIDLNLVDKSLMTFEEIEWLNNYHQAVFEKLSPGLDAELVTWLKGATNAI